MSDKLLWKEFKSGNRKAFETIYNTYFELLLAYGQRFSVDNSTVEDAIQELFVELWQKKERLADVDYIKPYLLLSIKRKIIRQVKKQRFTEAEEYHFEAQLDVEKIMVQQEWSAERSNKFKAAFSDLSDRQKEILYLKYFAELGYDEIAQQMNMNYQSARNLVHRAITKLTDLISVLVFMFLSEYKMLTHYFTE